MPSGLLRKKFLGEISGLKRKPFNIQNLKLKIPKALPRMEKSL